MGNETNSTIIGNVKFDGVKVLKSEVKRTSQGNLNCVWTDAGYLEYKDQKLIKGSGGSLQINAKVRSISYVEFGTKNLDIKDVVSGYINFDTSKYKSVTYTGTVNGLDYSTFTLNAKNNCKDIICIDPEIKYDMDESDEYIIHEKPSRHNQISDLVEHKPIKNWFIIEE